MSDARPLVLVTGAAGLIGAPLVNRLAERYRVVGLDVVEAPDDWRGEELVECDLTDDDSVAQVLDSVRERHGAALASVVHLAAYYDFSGEPSPLYDELTVQGTGRLLRGLRERFRPFEQFVYASTHLVMKEADKDAVLTEDDELEGEWDYPRSKIEAEHLIERTRGDLPVVVARIAGAYDEEGHSPPLTQQLARIYEKQLESHLFPGDPECAMPFIHLEDVVDFFVTAVDARGKLDGMQVFFVAEPETVTYGELQDRMGELVHGEAWATLRVPAPVAKAGAWVKNKVGGEKQFIKPWMIELADQHYPLSMARAEQRLGWRARHRLIDVVPAMVRSLERDPKAFYERNDLPLPDDLESA